jgi:hypothetical protein
MTAASIFPRVHIGEVIRNAVVFNLKTARSDSVNADSLIETVAQFFTLLREREVEYVLVGGIALLQYVAGRNTEDIDLIMGLSSLERIPELEVETRDADFARGRFGDLKIDILLTSNPLFERVCRQYVTTQGLAEQEIPCATVEGLILLKLYALPSLYRQGNFARVGLYENDVATLIHYFHPQLDDLFRELSHHLSENDLTQVKKIVAEVQARLDRFADSSRNTGQET